jgi:hypothetical protein
METTGQKYRCSTAGQYALLVRAELMAKSGMEEAG